MKYRILIVDDEKDFRELVKRLISDDNREIETADSGAAAKQLILENAFQLVLLDMNLPDATGMEILEFIHKFNPDILTIIVTASREIGQAVKALTQGAYHYVVKPFKSEELKSIVRNAIDKIDLEKWVKTLEADIAAGESVVFIGKSKKIMEIKEQVEKLKEHLYSSILISGETGTGKGSLARYIHMQHHKNMTRFVHISCADISPNLLEAELFGYEKGAFTDAKKDKPGVFELANNGTLFLDEIDGIPLELQKKLLYFLDTKKIRRLGGTTEKTLKLSLIAATNTNLNELVEKKIFRQDLYYRLNMIHIQLPALREKIEDIRYITEHFLDFFSHRFNKPRKTLSEKALKKLESHDWKGNTRELKNVIERAMIFCEKNIIDESDLSIEGALIKNVPEAVLPLSKDEIVTFDEMCSRYVEQVLTLMEGNKTKTAEVLGITRATLNAKLKS